MHLAEGILALNDPELRSLYDLKIFVQCVFSNLEKQALFEQIFINQM